MLATGSRKVARASFVCTEECLSSAPHCDALVYSAWIPRRRLHAGSTRWFCAGWFVHCFPRMPFLWFQGGGAGGGHCSATQGAFVRPCIVRCPLPMIIPPFHHCAQVFFELYFGFNLLEARPCIFHSFVRVSVFVRWLSFHHHCSLALLVAP